MKLNDLEFNKWLIIVAMAMLVLSMVSCKTRTVAEPTYIKDYTVKYDDDSTLQKRFVSAFEEMAKYQRRNQSSKIKETTHVKDSTSTTVDKDGNIIRQDSWHKETNNYSEKDFLLLHDSITKLVIYKDSLYMYKSKVDSLAKELKDSKTIYKEKELSKVDKIFLKTGQLLYLVIVIITLFIIYNKYKKKN